METNYLEKFTQEEALQKFCPMIQKSCKGKKCMMFQFVNQGLVKIYDPKKPDNPPTEMVENLYICGLCNPISDKKSNVSIIYGEYDDS